MTKFWPGRVNCSVGETSEGRCDGWSFGTVLDLEEEATPEEGRAGGGNQAGSLSTVGPAQPWIAGLQAFYAISFLTEACDLGCSCQRRLS